MNTTSNVSPEALLSALVASGVDFHVSRVDGHRSTSGPGRRPVLRCRITGGPENLERAAVVLRQNGLPHATATRLRHHAWICPSTAGGYTFVVTGRPPGRLGEVLERRRLAHRVPDRDLDR